MRAVGLRCEHREDIPCVDDPAPRLSWALDRHGRASARPPTGSASTGLWDSGRVESSNSVDVAYAGRPLPAARASSRGRSRSGTRPARRRSGASRRASAPGSAGGPRAVDRAATGSTTRAIPVPGTDDELDETDMLLRRCRPCPYLRRASRSPRGVRRATLYATARGVVELELNGTRVGDAVLAPGWTDYRDAHRVRRARRHRRCCATARTCSARSSATAGTPASSASTAPRRATTTAREPELLCELHLEHADGTREVDRHRRAAGRPRPGRSCYSDLLMGERYDARRELGAVGDPVTRARARDGVRARCPSARSRSA